MMEDSKKTAENILNQGKKAFEDGKEAMMDSSVDEATSFLSPSTWMMLALGSMVLSIIGETKAKRKEPGNFFGLWAPCFLIMGIFSKIQEKER